jgi:hypothetical protein
MTSTPISKELDRLSDEVLGVLASVSSVNRYASASPVLYSQYALRVTPDNLRAWHVRRVAIAVAERTAPDVRCAIDDYAEAILVWRDAAGPRMFWSTIAAKLGAPAPEGFGFVVTAENLRGWWHRRKRSGEKAAATLESVRVGVQSSGRALVARPPSAGHVTVAAPKVAAFSFPVAGENDAQRRIRESRAAAANKTSGVDALLSQFEANQAKPAADSAS